MSHYQHLLRGTQGEAARLVDDSNPTIQITAFKKVQSLLKFLQSLYENPPQNFVGIPQTTNKFTIIYYVMQGKVIELKPRRIKEIKKVR